MLDMKNLTRSRFLITHTHRGLVAGFAVFYSILISLGAASDKQALIHTPVGRKKTKSFLAKNS